MPQELHVLRCYNCRTFQVHIVKKSKKWECKMCGEKQSLKKVYGRGNGRDCRLHVQRLNEMCIKKRERLDNYDNSDIQMKRNLEEPPPHLHRIEPKENRSSFSNVSKWNQFLNETEESDSKTISSPSFYTDTQAIGCKVTESSVSNELTSHTSRNLCSEKETAFLKIVPEYSQQRKSSNEYQNSFAAFGIRTKAKDSNSSTNLWNKMPVTTAGSCDNNLEEGNYKVNEILSSKNYTHDVKYDINSIGLPKKFTTAAESQTHLSSTPCLMMEKDYSEEELDNILSFY